MLYKLFYFIFCFSVSQYCLSKTVSFHLGYCHAPYFGGVVDDEKTCRLKLKHYTRQRVETLQRDCYRQSQSERTLTIKNSSQSSTRSPPSLPSSPLPHHRNHTGLLFRQCATRLSVAVLDIAFQVT